MQNGHLNAVSVILLKDLRVLGLVCKNAKSLRLPQYFSLDKTEAKLFRQTKGNEGIMIFSFQTNPLLIFTSNPPKPPNYSICVCLLS